jgi:hypothetical protein
MAKDKNHSSKNQAAKNHRNGIKKPQLQKYASLKGVIYLFYLGQPKILEKQKKSHQKRPQH